MKGARVSAPSGTFQLSRGDTMNEEPARDPRLTTATAISVARSLTTCVSRNDALTTEVFASTWPGKSWMAMW
jgi:hypothetical protein